jgi:hypothetical protein
MSAGVDTEITGSPGEMRALAEALRTAVTPALQTVGESLVSARQGAEDSWRSPAGEGFTSTTSGMIRPIDALELFARASADGLDTLAAEIDSCQRHMDAIREDATGAGLSVNGFVIEDPGPALTAPASLPADADAAAVAGHSRQTAEYEAQNARIDAFTRAASEAGEVRAKETTAARLWGDVVGTKQQAKLGFTVADFVVGGLVAGGIELRGDRHLRAAKDALARNKELRALLPGTVDLDSRAALLREMSDNTDIAKMGQENWRASNRLGGAVTKWGGGVLAVGGVAYDIAVLDKPWYQAVTSGGASFGASVVTGAMIGSAIPVPLLGTAVGAAVGAGVGIFTSGAVDNLFEDENRSVSSASKAGWRALTDAGGALEDASVSVWKSLF